MKKIFILASVVIIAMTSCKKDEVIIDNNLNNEIGFSTFTHKATKATPITGTNIKTETADIKVYSYIHAKTAGGTATAYFDEVLDYNTNSAWTAGTTRYWPSTALNDGGANRLSFFAYYPSSISTTWDGSPFTTNTSNKPKFPFIVPSTAATQVDLLVSAVEGQHYESNTPKGEVPFTFSHALSQVIFSIKGDTDDLYYTATKIVIGNSLLHNTGTYTYGGGWGSTSGTASYTLNFTTGNEVKGTTPAVSLVQSNNNLMLLPQTLANNTTIAITYAVRDAAGTDGNEILPSGEKSVKISTGTTKWEAGKRYHYVITLPSGTHPITYSVTVTAWDESTTEPVTVS